MLASGTLVAEMYERGTLYCEKWIIRISRRILIRCIVARENVKSCSTYESRTRGRVKSVGIIGSKVCAPCTHDSSTHSQVSRQETTLVSAFSKFLCREHRTLSRIRWRGKERKNSPKLSPCEKIAKMNEKTRDRQIWKGMRERIIFPPRSLKSRHDTRSLCIHQERRKH